MRRTASRLPVARLVLGLLLVLPPLVASLAAQVAGRNVNMVSGGTFPGGDPYLQKQNEPSIAVSTRTEEGAWWNGKPARGTRHEAKPL